MNATYLKLRKAIEVTDNGYYVTVVVQAFKADDTSVYHGNITSQFPIEKGGLYDRLHQRLISNTSSRSLQDYRNDREPRNFDLEDEQFLIDVLMWHEIKAVEYNTKVYAIFKSLSILPHSPAFAIDPTAIHAHQPSTWLLQVRYNPNPALGNTGFDLDWVDWPLTSEDPQPVSGCVHFSVPLIYALYYVLGATTIRFTKALEYIDDDSYITAIAFKAYDVDNNLVYIGNITSQLPLVLP
jgi:hypothetical protein